MRRTMGACTVAIAIIGLAVAPRTAIAQDALTLALLTQNFAIVPDGVVHLEYELAGTIPDLTPPSTTASTTPATTATTVAASPSADPAAPGDTAAPSTSGETTSTPSTITAPAITDPELTILVTALEPITLRSEVSEMLEGGRRSAIDSAEFDLLDVLGTEQNGTTSRRPLILDVIN